MYQNVRSIRNKSTEVLKNFLLFIQEYDVIVLTETWLDDDLSIYKTIFKDFELYWQNRDLPGIDLGGGVLIIVHKNYFSKKIDFVDTDLSYEKIFVKVSKNSQNFIISTAYIPPKSDISCYIDFRVIIENLKKSNLDYKILITGDFNLPDIDWSINNCNNICKYIINESTRGDVKNIIKFIYEEFKNLGLTQYNVIKNKSGNILDLVFSNSRTFISESSDFLVGIDNFHPVLEINLEFESVWENKTKYLKCNFHKYDFVNADYDKINSELLLLDWNIIIGNLDCIAATEKVYEILNELFEKILRKKTVVTDNFPRWFSAKLKKLIIEKKIAHLKYKELKTEESYQKFKNLRTESKTEIDRCYKKLIGNTEKRILDDPKYFWQFLIIKNNKHVFPKNMSYENKSSEDNAQTSELFAEFFSSVYQTLDDSTIELLDIPDDGINIEIGIDEIIKTIREIKDGYSLGVDGIPMHFLKKTNVAISHALHIIFNKSIAEGVVHPYWKTCNITPVYKDGESHEVGNYRPVSIMPSIPKILDSIISKLLTRSFETELSDSQHGFAAGRSSTTNLSVLTSQIVNSFKDHSQVDVIYTDFRKAFDLVNPKVIVNKLIKLKFPGRMISWLLMYLTGRFGRVKVNGVFSNWFEINSGVPQGSNIGPKLFLIFINDLPSILKFAKVLLFADDMKILLKICSMLDCYKMQSDIDRVNEWCDRNLIQFNLKKCFTISFHRKKQEFIMFDYSIQNVKLQRVESVRDLGIILDSELSFEEHINAVVLKASRRWYTIQRHCGDFRNPQTIKVLYLSLVRSILVYGSVIWRPLYENSMYRIEKIQHKALRRISYVSGSPMHWSDHSYGEIMSLMRIPTVQSFFDYQDLIFVYKLTTNPHCKNYATDYLKMNNCDDESYNLRVKLPFTEELIKRNYILKDPFIRCVRKYNEKCIKNEKYRNFDILFENMKVFIKKDVLEYK